MTATLRVVPPQCYKCNRFVPSWRADVVYDYYMGGYEEGYTECASCSGIPDSDHYRNPLRSHEPPRNSGEADAVNGPTALGEKATASE